MNDPRLTKMDVITTETGRKRDQKEPNKHRVKKTKLLQNYLIYKNKLILPI